MKNYGKVKDKEMVYEIKIKGLRVGYV